MLFYVFVCVVCCLMALCGLFVRLCFMCLRILREMYGVTLHGCLLKVDWCALCVNMRV